MCAGAAVCAKRTIGEHKQIKANQQRRNLGIDCSAPYSDLSSDRKPRTDQLDDNLPAAERRGKSKIFMDAISSFALHAANASWARVAFLIHQVRNSFQNHQIVDYCNKAFFARARIL